MVVVVVAVCRTQTCSEVQKKEMKQVETEKSWGDDKEQHDGDAAPRRPTTGGFYRRSKRGRWTLLNKFFFYIFNKFFRTVS